MRLVLARSHNGPRLVRLTGNAPYFSFCFFELRFLFNFFLCLFCWIFINILSVFQMDLFLIHSLSNSSRLLFVSGSLCTYVDDLFARVVGRCALDVGCNILAEGSLGITARRPQAICRELVARRSQPAARHPVRLNAMLM